jgi:hypothetical protein
LYFAQVALFLSVSGFPILICQVEVRSDYSSVVLLLVRFGLGCFFFMNKSLWVWAFHVQSNDDILLCLLNETGILVSK